MNIAAMRLPSPNRADTDYPVEQVTTLKLQLDAGSDLPLYRQIVDHVWLEVIEDRLHPGQRLPTVRQLAITLGVHLDTVGRAYRELELLGVVHTRRGEGTVVGLKASQQAELERQRRLEALCTRAADEARAIGCTIGDVVELLTEMRRTGAKGGNDGK